MDQNLLALFMGASGNAGAAFPAFAEGRIATPSGAATTLTAMKLGDAHSSRRVVVCVATYKYLATLTPTAVTVGGSAATKITSISNGFGFDSSMWIIDLAAGATADVIVTTGSTTADKLAVAVYALYGAQSHGLASVTNQTSTASVASLGSLAVRKGGAVIATSMITSPYATNVPTSVDLDLVMNNGFYEAKFASGAGYALADSPIQPTLGFWYSGAAASFAPQAVAPSGVIFAGSYGSNTTSVTLVPAHKKDDVLVAFAASTGTAPVLPSGWTQAFAGTVGGSKILLAYKFATTNAETVTGFTNAAYLGVNVYHGVDLSSPIGATATASGSSTTVTYPALTMTVTDGASRVAAFSHLSFSASANLAVAPAGMTYREVLRSFANPTIASFDTAAGVASWSAQTASIGGTTPAWASITFELKKRT